MSSSEPHRRNRPRRLIAGVTGVVALALGTSGCLLQVLADGSDQPEGLPEVAWTPPAGMPDEVGSKAELRQMAQAVLDRRARALREGSLSDFAMDLDRSDPDFVAAQRRLFDNLEQLPLQVLDYEVEKDTWNTNYAEDQWESTASIPFVRERIQLQGFDRYPVETVFGVTFAERGGRWRIVSDTDVSQMTAEGAQEAPWDLTAIRVVQAPTGFSGSSTRARSTAPRPSCLRPRTASTSSPGLSRSGGTGPWCSTPCRTRRHCRGSAGSPAGTWTR